MVSRYTRRKIGINKTDQYKNLIESRGRKQINHYFTPNLKHPSVEDVIDFTVISHEWKEGDKFYKLANKYYNDSEMWWVIAWYNQKPTEAHLERGDVVDIPLPLEQVLSSMDI